MPDPDLEIRGGEGSSTPLEKGAPFGPQFGLKIGGSPGPLPWIRHWKVSIFVAKNPFFTRLLEAKRSVVAHFNSLDLNGDGIISFEEFDEDMAQERSKIENKNVQT